MREGRRGVFVFLDLGVEARIVGVFYGLTPLQVIEILEHTGRDRAMRFAQDLCRATVRQLLERCGRPSPRLRP